MPSERRAIDSTSAGVGGVAGDRRQELDELVAFEAGEVDPLDPRLAFGLGEPGRQRMAAVELIGPERADDEQPLVACVAGQECEEVARRAIGPVQVLDDEEDRCRLAEPAEEAEDPLEDPGLEPFDLAGRRGPVIGDRGQLRDEPGELGKAGSGGGGDALAVDVAAQCAERLDDRPERQAIVSEGDRASFEDEPPAIADGLAELGDEAALADARLSTDEQHLGVAGRCGVGRGEERLQLADATDEDGAGKPPSHARHDRARASSPHPQ